ncbi:bifunctional DNA primase/polymerase [Nocardia brasiliensis]|uniref:bifunctional DNA primase/polymerase n=1 Tax=Nocardia brasiliensis TaxID=37326 RepID=UPI003CC7CFF1
MFPLSPGRKKPPIVKNWPRHASTDAQRIRRWWSWNPRFNLLTGLNSDTPHRCAWLQLFGR